ncbi:MAG: 4-(cytidine 5'-diphospho)-2-C-methyl-D-erythritol kinase [Solirubrobacteraceae bacterium]
MRLRARAPGKVNLCLVLGGSRDDGRHRLVTLFESVSLADDLSLTTLEGEHPDEVLCTAVPGVNLVSEALAELRAVGWAGPPVRIEINKRIPVAAGMGGGSADAAAALRLAGELVPGRAEEMAAVAVALGADVPSQLAPGLVLGTGAGEIVEPVAPLAEHAFVLIPLPYALSTPQVYREADRLGLPREPRALDGAHARLLDELRPGARLPAELLVNDLQPAAESLCEAVPAALAAARACGAEAAMVCGSGPTVAGLFWGEDGHTRAKAAAVELSVRFAGAVAATPVDAEFGFPTVS